MMTTTPKPGDVLTAEQVRNLPDGAVVETTCRYTVTERSAADLAYLASSGENTVSLISLPTPPDMAPGSVVLDDDGMAWVRVSGHWYNPVARDVSRWSDLAPTVSFPEGVLHDAANPEVTP